MSSPAVVDANLAVYCVLKTPYSATATRAMERLAQRGSQLFAPGLWWYEVTSVIHRYRFAELISDSLDGRCLVNVSGSLYPLRYGVFLSASGNKIVCGSASCTS